MRITWVLRSFLQYRVPVFTALNKLAEGDLTVIFPDSKSPHCVRASLKDCLGANAIELSGEVAVNTHRQGNGFANSSWLLTYQPHLRSSIRSSKPDVLIGDAFGQWTVPLIIMRATRGTALVICYERTKHMERNAQLLRRIYRRVAIKFVDAACCNGTQSREYLLQLGISGHSITTGFMVPDPVLRHACGNLRPETIQNLRAERDFQGLVFLFAGRLVDPKGVMPMLDAWRRFSEGVDERIQLVVAGDGERRRDALSFCRKHHLRNVSILGPVQYEEMGKLYAASDYLLMPTLEDNWSLVVPEAMSFGRPVLCSKYNGCWPELVKQDKNGWVFDPLNPEDFLRVLRLAYKNRHRIDEMAAVSRAIVAKYTPESAAAAIYRACEIACDIRRGHRRRGTKLPLLRSSKPWEQTKAVTS